MAEFDFNNLHQQTRKRFAELGKSGATLDAWLAELAQRWQQAEDFLAQRPTEMRSHIACGPGCQTCCVVNVSTSLLEAIAIADFIRQLEPAQQSEFLHRLTSLWNAVRGLEDDERMLQRKSCAFVDAQGRCTIYPVRPLICRGVTSTDPEDCKNALHGEVFGETRPVLMNQFQKQLYEALFVGLTTGLQDAGFDSRSYPLTGIVRYLLNNPNTAGGLLINKTLTWDMLYP